eukprot:651556-Hanusia_phi.AAC.4
MEHQRQTIIISHLACQRAGQARVSFHSQHVDLRLQLDPRQRRAEEDRSEIHERKVREVPTARIGPPAPHDDASDPR